MRVIEHSVVIARPPHEVFDFVNDFRAYPQWQAGVIKAEKISGGPLGVGSWVEETRRLVGRQIKLRWQVTEFEPGRKRGFKVTQGPALSEGAMTFETTGEGSTRFAVRVEMHGRGPFRLLEPLLVGALNRQNQIDFARLKVVLESRKVTRV